LLDGQAMDWTAGAGRLTLEVRSIAPEAQTLRVVINGESRDEIALADHEWHVLDYALSEGSDPALGPRVELWADPPYEPGGGDGRRLGVMTRGLAWAE
jgi:hypothetical protein|tara:strand:+ start:1998 stop:2291 length:294 start_codon:yes stop_codon:yes gene_type:complete